MCVCVMHAGIDILIHWSRYLAVDGSSLTNQFFFCHGAVSGNIQNMLFNFATRFIIVVNVAVTACYELRRMLPEHYAIVNGLYIDILVMWSCAYYSSISLYSSNGPFISNSEAVFFMCSLKAKGLICVSRTFPNTVKKGVNKHIRFDLLFGGIFERISFSA